MQKHTKIYFDHFHYGEQDAIRCEWCGKIAVDIHHIYPRSTGKTFKHNRVGLDINDIQNLIALCRKCHEQAHDYTLTKGALWVCHQQTIYGKGIK